MTDKVQKIREGIERLKSQLIRGACASQIVMETYCKEEAYNQVLTILDSLQKEPISNDLEEASRQYALNNTPYEDCAEEMQEAFKAGAKWQKEKDESITNDLGEYINELSKQFPEVSFAKLSRIAVRVAQWQKEKMMAKAIDGDITFDYYGDDDKTYGCIAHDSFCLEDLGLKDTDKVKMIIINED